jgi:hypothetical protein
LRTGLNKGSFRTKEIKACMPYPMNIYERMIKDLGEPESQTQILILFNEFKNCDYFKEIFLQKLRECSDSTMIFYVTEMAIVKIDTDIETILDLISNLNANMKSIIWNADWNKKDANETNPDIELTIEEIIEAKEKILNLIRFKENFDDQMLNLIHAISLIWSLEEIVKRKESFIQYRYIASDRLAKDNTLKEILKKDAQKNEMKEKI